MSCAASALPANSALTKSSRISHSRYFPAPGVHDRRTAHEQDALAGGTRREQFARHFRDERFLRLLARNRARHEFEDLLAARTLQRLDADARVPDDDLVTGPHVGRRDREGTFPAQHDRTIHLRQRDRQPVSGDAHLGFEVRRRVEVVGQDAVARGRLRSDVGIVGKDSADVAQLVEQVAEVLAGVRFDTQARGAGLGGGLADREVIDRIARVLVVHDDFEYVTEDPRVEDVAAQLDLADVRSRAILRRVRHRRRFAVRRAGALSLRTDAPRLAKRTGATLPCR